MHHANDTREPRDGGYDDGYPACPCFWGREPASFVRRFVDIAGEQLPGSYVLDAGCGEGKNARYLAAHGARVYAVDVSSAAIDNARQWIACARIEWAVTDITAVALVDETYNAVIAYGLFHCLASAAEAREVIAQLRAATAPGGHHVVCAFNDRHQDLSAHPGFEPLLVSHEWYLAQYDGWEIVEATDSDLHEVHPHNQRPHAHSLTRLIARAPSRAS